MDDLELIERFLHGRLDKNEAAGFIRRLQTDTRLKQLFDRETVLESQLYNQAIAYAAVPGLRTEADWNELAVPLESTGGHTIADDELQHMVTNAVDTLPARQTLLHFIPPAKLRYLAAAMLVLAVGGAAFFGLLFFNHRQPPAYLTSSGRPTTQSIPVTVAQVPVYRISRPGSGVVTAGQTGIIAIDTQTAALADQHTSIQCREYRDTAITLSMNSGTALFSVQKGKYRFFRVRTPYAEVLVTGTVFRVAIEKSCCLVRVENGSVMVNHTEKALSLPVEPGETVRADADTLMEVWIQERIDELTARRKLLSGFLGRPFPPLHDPAGFVDPLRSHSGENTEIAGIRRSILQGTPGIDSIVLTLAKIRRGDPAACGLLVDLSRFYEARGRWYDAAAVLDAAGQCDTTPQSSLHETVRYRRGRLLLQGGDTASATEAFKRFIAEFPGSVWAPDIAGPLLSITRKQAGIDSADAMITAFVSERSECVSDRTVMEHADALRENGLFNRALFWYEYAVTAFSDSKYRGDAMYWAGWCIVQQSIEKREKRAFNHK